MSGEDSFEKTSKFGIVGKLEKEPRYAAMIGLGFELGAAHQDIAELLRVFSGEHVEVKQVRDRTRYRHKSAREYGRSLMQENIAAADVEWAKQTVLPYMEIHRASILWRHEPRGAAVAWHALSNNVSERVFAKIISDLYSNQDAFEGLRGTFKRSLVKAGGKDKLLEELMAVAGDANIQAYKEFAGHLIEEAEEWRDKKLHHRALWQRDPSVRAAVADLLEKNSSARELMDTVKRMMGEELKESSVYQLISRFRANPQVALERLRRRLKEQEGAQTDETLEQALELSEEVLGFVQADFFNRNPRAALIVARMTGLGANTATIKKGLDTHYPTHGIAEEKILAALGSAQKRMECLNAFDKHDHWLRIKDADRHFIENRAAEIMRDLDSK